MIGAISLVLFPWTTERHLMDFEAFIFRASITYFIIDTILGIIHKFNDGPMLAHHLISIAAYSTALYL